MDLGWEGAFSMSKLATGTWAGRGRGRFRAFISQHQIRTQEQQHNRITTRDKNKATQHNAVASINTKHNKCWQNPFWHWIPRLCLRWSEELNPHFAHLLRNPLKRTTLRESYWHETTAQPSQPLQDKQHQQREQVIHMQADRHAQHVGKKLVKLLGTPWEKSCSWRCHPFQNASAAFKDKATYILLVRQGMRRKIIIDN